jgi:CRISPR/Cas system endoribonuclease Cas6 (RAMP superfamily)
MALDNVARSNVLEAMQAAVFENRVRTAAQTIYQALIDAELTAVMEHLRVANCVNSVVGTSRSVKY